LRHGRALVLRLNLAACELKLDHRVLTLVQSNHRELLLNLLLDRLRVGSPHTRLLGAIDLVVRGSRSLPMLGVYNGLRFSNVAFMLFALLHFSLLLKGIYRRVESYFLASRLQGAVSVLRLALVLHLQVGRVLRLVVILLRRRLRRVQRAGIVSLGRLLIRLSVGPIATTTRGASIAGSRGWRGILLLEIVRLCEILIAVTHLSVGVHSVLPLRCGYGLIRVRACGLYRVHHHLAARVLLASSGRVLLLSRLFGVCLGEAPTATSLEVGIIHQVHSRPCAILLIPDVDGRLVNIFKFGLQVLKKRVALVSQSG
jgi:hypothetical protein